MSGWIKMHRAAIEHPLFRGNVKYLGAWMWMLNAAAWKPHKTRIRKRLVPLDRAQLLAGREYLAEAWGWGVREVRTFLDALETEGMIEKTVDQKITIITICNYTKYQDLGPVTDQKETSNRPVTDHTEEGKEGKENKNIRAHAHARDAAEMRAALRPTENDLGVVFENGVPQLINGTRAEFLDLFDGDERQLKAALEQCLGLATAIEVRKKLGNLAGHKRNVSQTMTNNYDRRVAKNQPKVTARNVRMFA